MITSLLLTSFHTKTKQSTTYEQYRFIVLIGDSLSITMWHNDKINYHLTSSIGKVTHIIILTTRVTFLLQSCEKYMYTGCMWPCLYMFINNIYKCKLITCNWHNAIWQILKKLICTLMVDILWILTLWSVDVVMTCIKKKWLNYQTW